MQNQGRIIHSCRSREFYISLPAFWVCFLIQSTLFSQQVDPCHFDYGFWSAKLPMPASRVAMEGMVFSGRIFVIGGLPGADGPAELSKEVWSYDPESDHWDTTLAALPEPRAFFGKHSCVLGNRLYVIGGTKPDSDEPGYSARVDIYDPGADIWTSGSDLPVSLGGIGVCALKGQIYVCGGISQDQQPLRSLYRYNPVAETWHREPDMLTPRYRHTAVAVGGKMYAMGGISDPAASAGLKHAEVYDPAKKSWSTISSIPTQVCEMASSVQGEDIYLFGGKVTLNAGKLNTVMKYHVSTDSWRMMDHLPGQLCLAAACAIERRIYLFGGASSREPGIDRVWAYDLSQVVLEREIPDLLMDQDSLMIDLSRYFSHAIGGKIEYAVCATSDPTVASTWIHDSLLIIKGIEGGEVQIWIVAESGDNRAGDSFSITNLYTSNHPSAFRSATVVAFPNPVCNNLYLKARNTGEYMVSIRRIDGQLILSKRISDPYFTLNISYLPGGIYLIRAWNSRFETTKKLLKF
jgi:N-acetylneuraminic acid mutarotase